MGSKKISKRQHELYVFAMYHNASQSRQNDFPSKTVHNPALYVQCSEKNSKGGKLDRTFQIMKKKSWCTI